MSFPDDWLAFWENLLWYKLFLLGFTFSGNAKIDPYANTKKKFSLNKSGHKFRKIHNIPMYYTIFLSIQRSVYYTVCIYWGTYKTTTFMKRVLCFPKKWFPKFKWYESLSLHKAHKAQIISLIILHSMFSLFCLRLSVLVTRNSTILVNRNILYSFHFEYLQRKYIFCPENSQNSVSPARVQTS